MLLRLISLLGSWFAPKAKAKPKVKPRPQLGSRLEPLEDRIAPAAFVNAHIVTYTDPDGAHVTIKSSTPLFTKTNVNTIFTFSTGSVDGTSTPQQLQFINLAGLASNLVTKDNISVTAKTPSGAVGVANVGFIDSSVGLGHVLIQGDLGRINAGSDNSADYVGLASLTVDSLGAQGTATQIAGGNLVSDIYGQIGSIVIQNNMVGAEISVASNTAGSFVNGNIGSVKIGGNLTGGAAVSIGVSGAIITQGNVNSIVIGGDLQGGSGTNSGSLQIGGKIGTLSVKDVVGYTVRPSLPAAISIPAASAPSPSPATSWAAMALAPPALAAVALPQVSRQIPAARSAPRKSGAPSPAASAITPPRSPALPSALSP
jgi:hypothetical protein